jgi:hypothetical protein
MLAPRDRDNNAWRRIAIASIAALKRAFAAEISPLCACTHQLDAYSDRLKSHRSEYRELSLSQ